jgi:predicted transcriptional regulator
MTGLFFKNSIQVDDILTYFYLSQKSSILLNDILDLESKNVYFNMFKEQNIILQYLDNYMDTLVDVVVLISKVLYIYLDYIKQNQPDFKVEIISNFFR